MISDGSDYKKFAEKLIGNDYIIPDEERIATEVLYSSENYYPDLGTVGNFVFRVNYLADALTLEIANIGVRINPSDIKDTAVKEGVVVYHKRNYDEEAGRDADYYCIIDILIFKAFTIKRYPGLAGKSGAYMASVGGFHNLADLSVDDYIENAVAFLGDTGTYVKNEEAILKELGAEDIRISAYAGTAVDPERKLALFKEDMQVNLSGHIVNQFEIVIFPATCPLIDTAVTLVIENDAKEFYTVSGVIIREKTLELRKKYRLNLLLTIDRASVLPDVKAMLTFIKDRFY